MSEREKRRAGRASNKRAFELRTSARREEQDLEEALQKKEITERQAKSIRKFWARAAEIQQRPSSFVVQGDAGQFIGEMKLLADSGRWAAWRYGPEYKDGPVIHETEQAALRYVKEGDKLSPAEELKSRIRGDYSRWVLVELYSGRWAPIWYACCDDEGYCRLILSEEFFDADNPSFPTPHEALATIIQRYEEEAAEVGQWVLSDEAHGNDIRRARNDMTKCQMSIGNSERAVKKMVGRASKDHLFVQVDGALIDATMTVTTVPADAVGPSHRKYRYDLSGGRSVAYGYSKREALDRLLEVGKERGWAVYQRLV
ncbi:hypothetical protein LL998_34040 (plasmid) [Burkholderia ambifaria]|uniref:hypothetical protein n=1 Tax=Burkholderia ambifaria TaxID=152480 RepID=UPI001E37D8C6|nr:hypothetical protein [Burkholderia ambifaria]UEP39762.1 hypothetical protein LL998_34040 [Burkholderia ambifaria]